MSDIRAQVSDILVKVSDIREQMSDICAQPLGGFCKRGLSLFCLTKMSSSAAVQMSDIREQVIDIRAQVIDILPKVIDIFPRAAANCRDFCGQRDSARANQPVDKRVIPKFRCKSPIFLWRMGIFR